MCGRFTLSTPAQILAELFNLEKFPKIVENYNIAPTQVISVVLEDRESKERHPFPCVWGLIPFWAKDPKIGAKLINARGETVAEKPSFRAAYKYRRCLVPADGFYEWKRAQDLKSKKQPYYFYMKRGVPFAMAGLWETWEKQPGAFITTFTIITTEANEVIKPIHPRMPVILTPKDFKEWLDPENTKPSPRLLQPLPSTEMEAHPVSHSVNNIQNNDENCVKPVTLVE